MKTREEIFNEVLESTHKGRTYIFIDIINDVQFLIDTQPLDAIMEGSVRDWETAEETEIRRVAKTGEFEDDMYCLIDLLIEDAKNFKEEVRCLELE